MRKITEQECETDDRPFLHFLVDYEIVDSTDEGGRKYTFYREVERIADGRLILTTDVSEGSVVARNYYEINKEEFAELLDRAIKQEQVDRSSRKTLLKLAQAPIEKNRQLPKDCVVYSDRRYRLAMENGRAVYYVDGARYEIGGHYYEPCIWLTGDNGGGVTIHDCDAGKWENFAKGRVSLMITGRELDPIDLCRMFEYSLYAGKKEQWFSSAKADEMFGDKPKQKATVIPKDPFYEVAKEYDRDAIGYCIVRDNYPTEREAHLRVLRAASQVLFKDSEGEGELNYDMNRARAKKVEVAELFEPSTQIRKMTFCDAFLGLPENNGFGRDDFARVCEALFPNGTDELEIMQWTTAWSDYFFSAQAWKACCYTVRDRSLDRYVVIMASTPD